MIYVFADRLMLLRERAGLRQVDLAKRMGMQPDYVSKWESGVRKPNMNGIVALCKAIGCSADELLGLKDLK